MIETKLFKVIRTFDGHEINMAEKFLRSVYFNENETLLKLFKEIISREEKDLSKQKVFSKIFPKKKFSDLKFRRQCSDLLILLEEFLAIRHFQKDEVSLHLNWIKTVNERKLTDLFSHSHNVGKLKQAKKEFHDADFFLHQYQLEEQLYFHFENLNKRSTEKNLMETVQNLDSFYIIRKLQYACVILHYGEVVSLETKIPMLDDLLNYLQKNKIDNPLIQNYYFILQMLLHPENENHFHQLKLQLSSAENKISKSVLRELYQHAVNYSVKKINYGKLNYLTEVFDLYKQMLKQKLLFDGKNLSQWDYKNLVVTACRLREFKWVEKFIEQYKIYLKPDERNNAVRYNQAKLAFYKNDFERVLKLLQTVEYSDVFYILDSKSMLLKAYYELNENDSLFSLCNSFSILLRRKKLISENHRVNHLNFIRFVKSLMRLDAKDNSKIKFLKKEIEQANKVADKSWLLEKIAEFL